MAIDDRACATHLLACGLVTRPTTITPWTAELLSKTCASATGFKGGASMITVVSSLESSGVHLLDSRAASSSDGLGEDAQPSIPTGSVALKMV